MPIREVRKSVRLTAILLTIGLASSGSLHAEDDPVIQAVHALAKIGSVPGLELHATYSDPSSSLPSGTEHWETTWRYRGMAWSMRSRCTDPLPGAIQQRTRHPQQDSDTLLAEAFAPLCESYVDGRIWWLDPRRGQAHVQQLDSNAWGRPPACSSNLLQVSCSFLGWPTQRNEEAVPLLWQQVQHETNLRAALRRLAPTIPVPDTPVHAIRIFTRPVPGPSDSDHITMVMTVTLSRHPECGGEWAIDEWAWTFQGPPALHAASRHFAYAPLATPAGAVPLPSRITTTLADGRLQDTLIVDRPVIRTLADADLAFDASLAHDVIDDDTGAHLQR